MSTLLFKTMIACFFPFLLTQCQAETTEIPRTSTLKSTQLASSFVVDERNKNGENSIQVALLLDTSNSMDGLIEQAKSRLWNIVNTLTTLKYDGKSPDIEIALYEYGNDGIEQADDYIRQVVPLTQDLDLISERLFSLRTNGGNEYCGAVIAKADGQLKWDDNKSMKLIYIAGNEPFDQGSVSYKESISGARAKDIFVNTIFCGDKGEGERTFWKDGAERGKGEYFNIDSDRKVIYIATPYDVQIQDCNRRLNDTYVGYGALGYEKKEMQYVQDENASSIAEENMIERTISKSKKNAYKNTSWDLVDKYEDDPNFLQKLMIKIYPKS